MPEFDVVLLTESRYDQPEKIDWYIENILKEDQLVREALEAKGLTVTRQDWANPKFDWSSCKVALFRATWDYFHRYEEFSTWLDKVSQATEFINPIELIRWNLDKHYLRDLESRGINITSSTFIEVGDTRSLQEICDTVHADDYVLKPTVSGGARHTYQLHRDNIAAHEEIFKELTEQEAMIVQPFQYSVLEQGEVAYMVYGGKFSHAVLKKGKDGDFRVQDDFGGTVHQYTPTEEEILFAESVVRGCKPQPLYARVDVLIDNQGELSVCELELIEPELWFRLHPRSASQLANCVYDKIQPSVLD